MSAVEAWRTGRARRNAKVSKAHTPLLVVIATVLAQVLPDWPTCRTAVCWFGGLGCCVAAAWMVAVPLGIAVLGMSLLVADTVASLR